MKVELCNCGAPAPDKSNNFCDNCGYLLNERINLDIDLISEELYALLLSEFRKQSDMAGYSFVNWEITAEVI